MSMNRDPEVRKEVLQVLKKFCSKNEKGEAECDVPGLMACLTEAKAENRKACDARDAVMAFLEEDEEIRMKRIIDEKVAGRNYVLVRRPRSDQPCPLRCQERQKRPKKSPDVFTFVSHYNAPIIPPEYGLADRFQEDVSHDSRDPSFNWPTDIVEDQSNDVDVDIKKLEKEMAKKFRLSI